jgi:hypothetical protein
MGGSVPPHGHIRHADLVEHSVPPLGLYFSNRLAYDTWAERVDDEAPGLHTRLLAVDVPDWGRAAFFQLADRCTPLTDDRVDALCDAARRLGSDQSDQVPEA